MAVTSPAASRSTCKRVKPSGYTKVSRLIAVSCSKNFGLYRERAGVAIAVARDAAAADVVSSQMQNVIRATISQTPDHGAEIVRVILEDKELRAEWEAELARCPEVGLAGALVGGVVTALAAGALWLLVRAGARVVRR